MGPQGPGVLPRGRTRTLALCVCVCVSEYVCVCEWGGFYLLAL